MSWLEIADAINRLLCRLMFIIIMIVYVIGIEKANLFELMVLSGIVLLSVKIDELKEKQ